MPTTQPTSSLNSLYPRSPKYLHTHLQALVRGRLRLRVMVIPRVFASIIRGLAAT